MDNIPLDKYIENVEASTDSTLLVHISHFQYTYMLIIYLGNMELTMCTFYLACILIYYLYLSVAV